VSWFELASAIAIGIMLGQVAASQIEPFASQLRWRLRPQDKIRMAQDALRRAIREENEAVISRRQPSGGSHAAR
jgi:hypothetical protein